MSFKNITVLSAVLLSALSMNVMADEATYSLEYTQTSPIKDISLKNAGLKVQVYKSDNPAGYQDMTTDENQTFKLDGAYDLEVVSIKGEEKYNAHCSGSATATNTKVMITCNPKNKTTDMSKPEELQD